jgi:protein phosphatase
MGTTSTAVAILDRNLYYAHVGDSRLYLVRDGKIYRLTRDHSYVGRLVEQGIINPDEAETHPQRNILTAALGAGVEISPESPDTAIALEAGDTLLLCTDGLWSLIREPELIAPLSQESPEQACRKLVAAARKLGAPDNVTVQILRIS